MAAFILWCILFVLCWPLALLALVLYPLVWLLTLPFRLVGIAVHGVGYDSRVIMLILVEGYPLTGIHKIRKCL